MRNMNSYGPIWEYVSPYWADRFMDRWCTKVMCSRIEPMKEIARTLRNHRGLILNWFKARYVISLGAVEGFNNKVKVVTRKAYGFRTFTSVEVALYHTLGDLPEPIVSHRFCLGGEFPIEKKGKHVRMPFCPNTEFIIGRVFHGLPSRSLSYCA